MNNSAINTDEFLTTLPDWQRANLELFREIVHEAIPDVVEEIKWGVPTFLYSGKVLFAMSGFKDHTKFNFFCNGALLDDKDKLFNNGLESKKSRGIDLHEGDAIDKLKLKALITEAVSKA